MMSMASAYACTPSFALPGTVALYFSREHAAAISKAPAPGITHLQCGSTVREYSVQGLYVSIAYVYRG